MALLWNGDKRQKRLMSLRKPSPTRKRYIKDQAQNLFRAIKGASLLTAFRREWAAGMTVEAALVLPIFLLFFLNFASLMEMMRLHGNLQFALWGTGNEAALYECVIGDDSVSLLSSFYIKNRMVSNLGREYLEQSPLENGVSGLSVWVNPLNKDILDVTVRYKAAPISAFIGFPPFEMSNHYYGHLWNGYDISGGGLESDPESVMVYMTENGRVYHSNRNCTHLLLSIRAVDKDIVGGLKNQWGRKYGACEKCARGERPDKIFITAEGESYHYSEGCAGLKRTVFAVPLEEVEGAYRPCSRCGG